MWHAHRKNFKNASDAPAVMGASTYKTRSQLLHETATGISADVDASTQRIFDEGHRIEALARPLAEDIIGQELYPVTGSLGDLSASFDGLTMDETICFEHKTLNDSIRDAANGASLPAMYRIQMEQQLLISGADKCLFMATRWNGSTCAEQIDFWYFPDSELRAKIIAAWVQFDKDVVAYSPRDLTGNPLASPIMQLPALTIRINGSVTVSNLPEFEVVAKAYVDSVSTDLVTDQDFSDAEANVKFFADAEKKLDQAKTDAISQTADIDALMKSIDFIKDTMRTKRLSLEKIVSAKKEQIKAQILNEGIIAFVAHIDALEVEIAPVRLNMKRPDFGGAIKNKRTLKALHDAVDTALAAGKIEADAIAKVIRTNLAYLKQFADYTGLFADLSTLALKDSDDFQAVVNNRISAEKSRIAEREAEVAQAAMQAAERAIAEAAKTALVPAPAQVFAPVAPLVAPAPSPKYAEKPTPSLHELASKIAFEYHIDVKTARGWIITAVNNEALRNAA